MQALSNLRLVFGVIINFRSFETNITILFNKIVKNVPGFEHTTLLQ